MQNTNARNIQNVYVEIPAGFIVTMCCVLSNRMLFNLREAAVKRKVLSTSNMFELSDITYTS